MQEELRERELVEYQILDTAPEKELDEIAQIASAVCNTPMSLVTFIDSQRQWYKAKKGVDMNEVRRADSFCQYALNTPGDLLVVGDPTTDDRFKNNRYVTGAPYIRFYAGAPLTSPRGNVLGTLCVMDSKSHDISEDQKEALQLLAKKAMQYLNMRKTMIQQGKMIEHSAEKLKKLTDLAPGILFQLEARSDQKIEPVFVSRGIQNIHPQLTVELFIANPSKFLDFVHEDDRQRLLESIKTSFYHHSVWSEEFRIMGENSEIKWYSINATIERKPEATVMYGSLFDISSMKQYQEVLHQILHDVSHVMRRPVTSMLGLVTLMEKDALDPGQIRAYMQHVKTVFNELDSFTRHLNRVYTERVKKSARIENLPLEN